MMGSGMYGFSIWGLLLNILVVLLIIGLAFALINRSDFMGSGNSERMARLEKDVEDIKKMVEDIKEKLDEI